MRFVKIFQSNPSNIYSHAKYEALQQRVNRYAQVNRYEIINISQSETYINKDHHILTVSVIFERIKPSVQF